MPQNIPILDICTLSEFKENDILISRLSDYLNDRNNFHFPHRHSFYHLVLFTKGGGSHTIDFSAFPVKPFQVYCMIPGQVHTWEFKGKMEGYVVNFSTSFFQSFLLRPDYLESFSFFSGIAEDGVLNVSKEIKDSVVSVFEQLIKSIDLKHSFRWDMIRTLLIQAFILIDQNTVNNKIAAAPNYNYALLKNFQKLIEKNYTQLKLPKEYADLLYITPNHLNALCKDHLGIAAGEVIRNRIILEAKRLLIHQYKSISEIAYALNFTDNSYFTKFFKKQAGITPEEFRKQTAHTH